jgi:hypothetical protein
VIIDGVKRHPAVEALNRWRPPMSGSRKARWGRSALAALIALAIGAIVSMHVDTQIRTPVGADGAAIDTYPYFHGQLLHAGPVVALIAATLAVR